MVIETALSPLYTGAYDGREGGFPGNPEGTSGTPLHPLVPGRAVMESGHGRRGGLSDVAAGKSNRGRGVKSKVGGGSGDEGSSEGHTTGIT